MAERFDFIEQILQESEERRQDERVEMDKLRADTMLKAVGCTGRTNGRCEYALRKGDCSDRGLPSVELSRLEKKRSWLTFNLDALYTCNWRKNDPAAQWNHQTPERT